MPRERRRLEDQEHRGCVAHGEEREAWGAQQGRSPQAQRVEKGRKLQGERCLCTSQTLDRDPRGLAGVPQDPLFNAPTKALMSVNAGGR